MVLGDMTKLCARDRLSPFLRPRFDGRKLLANPLPPAVREHLGRTTSYRYQKGRVPQRPAARHVPGAHCAVVTSGQCDLAVGSEADLVDVKTAVPGKWLRC